MERTEAIEVIRKNWPDASFTQLREALETLIPELKESEDERMYARVTKRYTRIEKYYLRALGETEANKVLKECEEEELWIKNLLEKQKEQKPAEWSEEDEKDYFYSDITEKMNSYLKGDAGWSSLCDATYCYDDDDTGASVASHLKLVEYLQKRGVL